MSLTPGRIVSVAIEKPAAGGWMIARVDGEILLVAGAIPGEQVRARITRTGHGVAYGDAVEVEQASPDRRAPFTDPACGGCLYAHIDYQRQLAIKSEVVADAFRRIGRLAIETPVVRPSPDNGYRMRARLHVRGTRVGFFREGTHELCDARPTRQLMASTLDVIDQLAAAIRSVRIESLREIELSENLDASGRAVALAAIGAVPPRVAEALAATPGLTGTLLTAEAAPAPRLIAGSPYVTDALAFGEATVRLRRHVLAFFQGNRYLLQPLVTRVLDEIEPASEIVDFYAGAGLFAIAAGVVRGARVTAVEGDRLGAADLAANAAAAGGRVNAVARPVESFRISRMKPALAIVDPPRTGMSRDALANILSVAAPRLVYVSCDVATLARDARKVVDAGHRLSALDAFDLFPNTPHVETVAVFERQ